MAKKAVKEERERMYECEVKRRRISIGGGYVPFWKVKPVYEALSDQDEEYRCKDCHGEVKLFSRHVAHGPSPHVEHKLRQDSEYCPAGMYFRQATDGRSPLSLTPVR